MTMMSKKFWLVICLIMVVLWAFIPAVPRANAEEVTEIPPIPTAEMLAVDDPSGVESVLTVSEELTHVMNTTLRDSVLAVLVVAGTVFGLLSGALATIVYIALKFTHKSVTPEAVKDIFLLGVQKGAEGLVDVSKRLPFPYEIDDKLAVAIASGVGRYLKEIGFIPPTTHADPPPDTVPLGG